MGPNRKESQSYVDMLRSFASNVGLPQVDVDNPPLTKFLQAGRAGVAIERIVADDVGRPGYVPTTSARPVRRKRADQRLVRFPQRP